MGASKRQMAKGASSPCVGHGKDHDGKWAIMDSVVDDHDHNTYMNSTSSSTSSLGEVSNGSSLSSESLSDMVDDASSSSTNSSSSSSSTSSLYDLSELMSQLPIKKGLSRFYEGKSQSFTTLSRVTSIEDLPKKETLPRRKMIKASKSYGGGLDRYKSHTLIPKPTISKKASRGSLSSLSCPSRRVSFVTSCGPPLIPSENKLD